MLSYRYRMGFLILLDSLIVLGTIFIGRFILEASLVLNNIVLISSAISLLIFHHTFAAVYGLYKKAWEYASVPELITIFKSVTLAIAATAIIQSILFQNMLVRILLVTWLLHLFLIVGSRLGWRFFRDTYYIKNKNLKRTMIIGAGAAGVIVARQLTKHNTSELKHVVFIDDDPKKQKLQIMNVKVDGTTLNIEEKIKQYDINHIIIAIPSLKTKRLNEIFIECSKSNVKTQLMPRIEDLMMGKVSVSQMRDVKVEDLLGREPVELNMDQIAKNLTGQTILVTGAGGSIGSEICRQVCKFNPKRLVLLGHGENSIYTIEMELREQFGHSSIEFATEIADIQDRDKMMSIMYKHRPSVVYHAAAHKHVPLMERNPEEAVKNNVIGTKNVAEAADRAGIGTFVMISSDKAVNPPNVMGATKRVAEMIIQHLDTVSATRFVAVRFGNVLGSRGSVIPLFKKQIAKGGPVTVTHPEMTRYFMTIPEASRLVIQAGALARGGEIFVLDMGEPVKIVDLAKNLIILSGYTEEDIEIKYSGIRPGEKMFEELLNENEVNKEEVYPKIHIGKTTLLPMELIEDILQHIQSDPHLLKQMVIDLANNRVEEMYKEIAAAK